MLKKFNEEDFEVLKGPLESYRQSPQSLGGVLLLGVFLQVLLIYFEYDDCSSTIFPNAIGIFNIHLWVSSIIIFFTIICAVPFIYQRWQKLQYFISILFSQNFGAVSFAISGLFLLGENPNITTRSLLTFSYIVVITGVLIFLVSSIRFYILLRKGAFRKGTTRDNLRNHIENIIKSHFGVILIICGVLGYMAQFLFKSHSEDTFMILLVFLIYFTMMFVLPEQLVILYCKYRFKSFNFDSHGNLYSSSNDEKRSEN
ncbi:ABC transporter ATPase [Heyndrickxia faecalis]|uniref:ABC transporter ATPase n=1 Tax=Heyndrickxia faecalis TaxID=2824910 RepID=UPI003D235440